MREILFRGKRLDNGEWVFGYFCEFANNQTGEQGSYIQTVKQDGRIDLIHKVDPSTVGQYTGMMDKNGKKIFEGDCLGHPHNVVEYLNDGFCVAGDRPLWLMAKYDVVVCNIHDMLGGGDG